MRKGKRDSELDQIHWKLRCLALDYLLGDVTKGGPSRRAKEEDAFRLFLVQPLQDHFHENPPVHAAIRGHPLAIEAHRAIESLYEQTTDTRRKLEPLLEHLRTHLEQVGTGTEMGPAYTHYAGVDGTLRSILSLLRDADPVNAEPLDESVLKELESLAQSFRTLLEAHDRPRRNEHLRRLVTKELGRPPTRKEWEERRWIGPTWEVVQSAFDALERVNAHLKRSNANIVLAGEPPYLIRMSTEGKPPNPFFRAYFSPFIDILTDSIRSPRIGVCAHCERVYVRDPHDRRGSTCGERCKAAFARDRRSTQADPPRN